MKSIGNLRVISLNLQFVLSSTVTLKTDIVFSVMFSHSLVRMMNTDKLQSSLGLLALYYIYLITLKVSAAAHAPAIEQNHFNIICSNILKLDCAIFLRDQNSKNCGTDRTTYNNSCEFAQGHCRSPSLHVQHSGPCVAGSGSGGAPQLSGLTVVLQLVCDDVVHVDCTGQPRVVLCASDGQTYDNSCFFEKARCGRYGLHVLRAGRC